MTILTADRLKHFVVYDEHTGVFVSRIKQNKWPAGRHLGFVNDAGYLRIWVDGKNYSGHRLAWLYMTGSFPSAGIDHIDRNKANNAWGNLREATQGQNNQNTSVYSSNKSGYPGVSWHRSKGKWRAVIQVGRRHSHIGYFDSPEEAAAAYQREKAQLHPFAVPRDLGQARSA